MVAGTRFHCGIFGQNYLILLAYIQFSTIWTYLKLFRGTRFNFFFLSVVLSFVNNIMHNLIDVNWSIGPFFWCIFWNYFNFVVVNVFVVNIHCVVHFYFIVIEMWKWRRLKMVLRLTMNTEQRVARFKCFGAKFAHQKWTKTMRWPNCRLVDWLAGNNIQMRAQTFIHRKKERRKKIPHLRILFVFYYECCVLISSAMAIVCVHVRVDDGKHCPYALRFSKPEMRHKRLAEMKTRNAPSEYQNTTLCYFA